MTEALAKRTVEPVVKCLKDAGLGASDINDLILVGGMTRMPMIVKTAKKLAGKDPHQGVNPDEVVAIGAAIQGGVLQGDVRDVLLLDVTPLTLALETAGAVATAIIERNTTIPTKKFQVFSTFADSQTAVDIKIVQGERPMANDNKVLGNFRLDGIPPAARGVPQIEVTFDIDANGILHVTAKDKGTGKEQKISITNSSGLSDEEIEKAKKEAEVNAEADLKRKESVEARNQCDNLVFQTDKQLSELGEKLPADKKKPVEDALADAKKVLENQAASGEELKAAAEKITEAFSAIAQDLYAQAGAEGAQPGGPTVDPSASPQPDAPQDPAKDDDVVDADFEVVDDDKDKK